MTQASTKKPLYRRLSGALGVRVRLGGLRAIENSSQIFQVVIGATSGYAFCHYVLGHPAPFLAAVAAVIGTGVTADKRLRRSIEIGLGATLGVLVGEILVHMFGIGVWQIAVVIFAGLVVGNILNSGALFVNQIAIQAVYVVAVPMSIATKPFDRTVDAIVGAVIAILMALIVPSDARKRPRNRAANLLYEISVLLKGTAKALRTADADLAQRVLERARESQAFVDSWRTSISVSQEATRINARSRRYAAEVTRLARACEYADRAMRLVRVVARRVVAMTATGEKRPGVAHPIEQLGEGAAMLRIALRRGTSRVPAEKFLTEVARTLSPKAGFVTDRHDETLVLLLRPLANDLMSAAGMTEDAANDVLPELDE